MSTRLPTNRPPSEIERRSRLIKSALKFVERTLLICGYMMLATAVILLVTGDYVRAAPAFVLGGISAYWTWRKFSRM